MAQLIEAYEPLGAIALSKEYPAEFLECLLFQTVEHRMSDDDRKQRDAQEELAKQKEDLMKREFRIQMTNERIPRVISLASFFPEGFDYQSAITGGNADGHPN